MDDFVAENVANMCDDDLTRCELYCLAHAGEHDEDLEAIQDELMLRGWKSI